VIGLVAGMSMALGCSDESGSATQQPAATAGASSDAGAPPAVSPQTASPQVAAPTDAAPAAADTRSPEERIAAGRGVYNGNCIACHAMDPRQDGALGPAVAGASPELLEARVMRAEYPAGYAPKRATRVMIPLPHLKDKLPELSAYLDSLE